MDNNLNNNFSNNPNNSPNVIRNNNRNMNMNEPIDFWRFFYVLRDKFLVILAVGLLFACGAAGYTKYFMTPTYTSTSMVLILSKETADLSSIAALNLGSQLTRDYTTLITSRPVCEKVIENLGLQMGYYQLKSSISLVNPENTHIMYISSTQADPRLAKAVVDEVAKVYAEYIADKMEVAPPKMIEEGEISTAKNGPDMKRNVMKGFLLGVALVCGILILLEWFNDTIQSEEDIEKYLNVPALAVVPDSMIRVSKKSKKSKNKKSTKQGKV